MSVWLWDLETRECLHVLKHPEVTCNIHPIHEPVYNHGGWGGGGSGGVDGEPLELWGRGGERATGEESSGSGRSGVDGWRGGGVGEGGGGACSVGYVDGGSGGGGVPRWQSWNQAGEVFRTTSRPMLYRR